MTGTLAGQHGGAQVIRSSRGRATPTTNEGARNMNIGNPLASVLEALMIEHGVKINSLAVEWTDTSSMIGQSFSLQRIAIEGELLLGAKRG
jgi:hypothetical protein